MVCFITSLATLWYPSLNPVSVLSISVLIGCLVIAKLLGLASLRYSVMRQMIAGVLALIAMLMVLPVAGGRPTWTDQLASGIIFLSFSFGYGLSAIRGPSKLVSVLAYALNGVSIYFITVLLLGSLDTILSEYRSARYLEGYIVLLVPALAPCIWMLASIRLFPVLTLPNRAQARITAGLCPTCAYDLRGSAAGSDCPECGEAVDWSKVVISEKV